MRADYGADIVDPDIRNAEFFAHERGDVFSVLKAIAVANVNAIMVLENGEIIERGDHDDLLAMKGRYYELYTGKKELS